MRSVLRVADSPCVPWWCGRSPFAARSAAAAAGPPFQQPDSLFNGAVMTLVTVPTLIYGADKAKKFDIPVSNL